MPFRVQLLGYRSASPPALRASDWLYTRLSKSLLSDSIKLRITRHLGSLSLVFARVLKRRLLRRQGRHLFPQLILPPPSLHYDASTSSVEGRFARRREKRGGVRCPAGPVSRAGRSGGAGAPPGPTMRSCQELTDDPRSTPNATPASSEVRGVARLDAGKREIWDESAARRPTSHQRNEHACGFASAVAHF